MEASPALAGKTGNIPEGATNQRSPMQCLSTSVTQHRNEEAKGIIPRRHYWEIMP